MKKATEVKVLFLHVKSANKDLVVTTARKLSKVRNKLVTQSAVVDAVLSYVRKNPKILNDIRN